MHVSNRETLVQSVLASGFAYDKHTTHDDNTLQWGTFVKKVRGIRRMGSAALDFAYVACGRYDGYWERSLNPWDAMAGMLLVREAGGIVTNYKGDARPQDDVRGRYVAGNPAIHSAILGVLHDTYDEDAL
jgi:myo-inositol-1(or 4)-monophosphatase